MLVLLGILQRYVIGQVFRSFALALLTLTSVIVLFMVMAEATRLGLGPKDVLNLVPFVIPSTMPYTIPVALLFSVTVVYGRLASDNEIIAVKASGRSVWTMLWPSVMMSIGLSFFLCVLSAEVIPRATHHFKSALFQNMEDTFYWFLKRERQFDTPHWPFFIGVKDVKDKILYGATFKHRAKGPGNLNHFDYVVQAKRARLQFNREQAMATVYLEGAEFQGGGNQPFVGTIPRDTIKIPIPKNSMGTYQKRVQEMTFHEMNQRKVWLYHQIKNERRQHAVRAALQLGAGRVQLIDWPHIRAAFRDYARWRQEWSEIDTEKNMRLALGVGSFFFVLLGAPVGIMFAKRDFLSAFISCFLPIIILYYPLVLAGVNMARTGQATAWVVWGGDLVLGVLAGFSLRTIQKH